MALLDRLLSRFRGAPVIQNEVQTGLSFDDVLRLFVRDGIDREVTPETAIKAIPVQACCALIGGGITSMPLRIVKREVVNGVMAQTPSDSHDFWWLFNEQPNGDSTSALLWQQIVQDMMLRERAYARIVRGSSGRSRSIREIVFHKYDSVIPEVKWDDSLRRKVITRYLIRDGEKAYGVLPEDMLDFRGIGGPCGSRMSQALYSARRAVAVCLTVEEYCDRFFDNGGMPRTTIKYPAGASLTDPQINRLREQWVERYGGASNAGLPLVLTNGGDVVKLSFTAEEAQMLEARKFQVIEIARAFGVPPFMIGETEKTSAWGTGLEQMSQGFIRYTLGPYITAIEQELNRKLFGIDRYFVDFDEEALARGDMKALGDWFRQAVGGSQGPGFMTIDEVRSRLKLPPAEGGDTLYVPKGASDAQGEKPPAGTAVSE